MTRVIKELAPVALGYVVGTVLVAAVCGYCRLVQVYETPAATATRALASGPIEHWSLDEAGQVRDMDPPLYTLRVSPGDAVQRSWRRSIFPCQRPVITNCANNPLSVNEIDLEGTRREWQSFRVCAYFEGFLTCYPITDLFPNSVTLETP